MYLQILDPSKAAKPVHTYGFKITSWTKSALGGRYDQISKYIIKFDRRYDQIWWDYMISFHWNLWSAFIGINDQIQSAYITRFHGNVWSDFIRIHLLIWSEYVIRFIRIYDSFDEDVWSDLIRIDDQIWSEYLIIFNRDISLNLTRLWDQVW